MSKRGGTSYIKGKWFTSICCYTDNLCQPLVIPLTYSFWPPRQEPSSHKRIIVMCKVDLADRSTTEKWMKHFGEQNYVCYGVNSHNKDSIKGARIKELKVGEANYTATMQMTVIPNVGKLAIANSMHQIG